MYTGYFSRMGHVQKKELFRYGSGKPEDAAVRVRAARNFTQLSQSQLAEIFGKGVSWVSSIESGRNRPPWELMLYFLEEHRIDMNFIVAGHYAQLPGDVQERLSEILAEIGNDTGARQK